MVSAVMASEDITGSTNSDSKTPKSKRFSLQLDVPLSENIQLNKQFHGADDFAPKARKPYTITKQRERWTEEEHKKFLDAIKLYGRAWKRIEDHVGTKTAVQIRSHAQKFFSKVGRESNNGYSDTTKPIEIPPPRAKRKPLHPYPRKLVSSLKLGNSTLEKPTCFMSQSMCLPGEANQSPTSVLTANCLDMTVATDSNNLDGCRSLGSSVEDSVGLNLSEQANLSPKVKVSPSSSQENVYQDQNEQTSVKPELFRQDNSFLKDDLVEVSSTHCLKLFGKTLLVTDSCSRSSLNFGDGNTHFSDLGDDSLSQTFPMVSDSVEHDVTNPDRSSKAGSSGAPAILYPPPMHRECSHVLNVSYSHSLSWSAYQGFLSFPSMKVYSPVPIKAQPMHDDREVPPAETNMQGSSSGDTVESESLAAESDNHANVMVGDRCASKATATTILKKRASTFKRMKGFLPYKRCLADGDGRLATNH